ncbi:PAS domain-containing protein [Methanoregula boonei]|nr:PAS domain-containing protein [Methanoregula boonei]
MVHPNGQDLHLIKSILKQSPEGMSVSEIARALRKNKNTTGRYLDILLISGQVDMRTYGMAKVYTLSQRVPLSAMLSYSKDLIVVLDRESRIVQINDNFLTLLRLTRKEIIGKDFASITSTDIDLHNLLTPPPSTRSEETERIVSTRLGTKERIFKQKSIPTVFDDGARGITVILSDTTEEILQEREIQIREERFRMMAENIQDALFIVENEKCTFANRRLAEITGYTFEELWDMDPMKIIVPEDRKKIEPLVDIREKSVLGPVEFQCRIQRKDGVNRQMYIRISSLNRGEAQYHFVILTDVTDLLSKDMALARSEQRFRMMAENVQDALLIIESGRITYANRRACEISGYSAEEMYSLHSREIIPLEARRVMGETYKKSLAPGEPAIKFQSWILCKNGEKRCIYGQMNSVRHSDAISTYITLTDVTAFAEHEQDLMDRIAGLEQGGGCISPPHPDAAPGFPGQK